MDALFGLANEVPHALLGSLTISPPPGITLAELRARVEILSSDTGLHAIWGLTYADCANGRPFAYMLATTDDSKRLERAARASVSGDSRSARFNRVFGSEYPWTPSNEVLRFNVGRVLRKLVRHSPCPTLRPGYRFGASGCFASLLSNALGIVRREHPCRVGGHERTRGRAGEVSPDAPGAALRVCRWCQLPVPGKAWRHPHCSTRRWRARAAIRAVLSPEDFDGFAYRADVLTCDARSEPEAMEAAFREIEGHGADLPRGFAEQTTMPREPVPPGYRPARRKGP